MIIKSDHVTFHIFSTFYSLTTYVELDDKYENDYCYEYDDNMPMHHKIEKVISLAIRQSRLIEDEFAGLDPRIIQYNDDPGIDDAWKGNITESYLDHSEYTYYKGNYIAVAQNEDSKGRNVLAPTTNVSPEIER